MGPRTTAAVIALAVAIALGWSAAHARADGDPASDVLAAQTLFLPQDAGALPAQQTELSGLLAAAQRRGYHLRVALIASSTDLGSITALWRQPHTYARFLGQELSAVYHGTLLVLMPNGYGLYGVRGVPTQPAALQGLNPPGTSLAGAAITAIRRLSAATGHPLPLPSQQSSSGGGSSNTIPWLVFAIGLALIALAWTVSLRLRPFGTPGQATHDMNESTAEQGSLH